MREKNRVALPADDKDLLTKTVAACDRLEEGLRDTTRALSRKIIRASAAVAIALVATVVSIVFAVQAAQTAHQLKVDRNDARIASCLQDVKRVSAIRTVLPKALLAIRPADAAPLTPEQQISLRSYAAEVDDGLPLRDCSPEGIKAYLRR